MTRRRQGKSFKFCRPWLAASVMKVRLRRELVAVSVAADKAGEVVVADRKLEDT